MKTKNTLLAIALLGLALLLPTSAMAQGPGGFGHGPGFGKGMRGHHGGGPMKMFEKHADELGLDDATLGKIKAIVETNKDKMETLMTSLHEARKQLHEMMAQDTPNESAILKHIDKIGVISTDLHKMRVQTMLRVRAELTPDQREKLKAIHGERQRRHKRHKELRQRGFDKGGPQ